MSRKTANMVRYRTLALLLSFLTLVARAHTIDEISRADGLLRLLDRRLEISVLVAQAKWNQGLPIEASEREAVVVEQFVTLARHEGLSEELARDFILAQIEGSKIVQRKLIARWQAERRGPFQNPPDLSTEIRPQLDQLTKDLIQSLKAYDEGSGGDFQLLTWRAEILWGTRLSSAQKAVLGFIRD